MLKQFITFDCIVLAHFKDGTSASNLKSHKNVNVKKKSLFLLKVVKVFDTFSEVKYFSKFEQISQILFNGLF